MKSPPPFLDLGVFICMRILIKESQYNVLFEQNNPNIQKAYNELIKGAKYPLGTSKDTILGAFNYIKNTQDFKTLISMFKDKKTGYGSFEEMINKEYDRFDYDDIIKLQEKLYSASVILNFDTAFNDFGSPHFDEGVTISYGESSNPKTVKVNQKCMSKYSPLLKQAQDYWRKWLSSPITKQKFKTNWNVQPKENTVDGKNVDDIFKEYFDCINNLKLVFYDNTMLHPPGVSEIDVSQHKGSYAFVHKNTPENIYVNCSLNDNDALGTMIHEIQHLLYHIKPLNPSITIGNVFLKPGNKKSGPKDSLHGLNNSVLKSKNKSNTQDLSNIASSLGVDVSKLYSWKKNAFIETQDKDPGYVCRQTEKASNIQSMRNLFGIKPGQNITLQMLKPYLKMEKQHTDISWILLCWASKGFKDINLFLSDLNKLAYQDTKPTNDTRLA
jgi:hypothetical protein